MKAFVNFALLSLLPLATLESQVDRICGRVLVEDVSAVCSISSPALSADASALLQHSKSHIVEGEHVHGVYPLSADQLEYASTAGSGCDAGNPGGGQSIFKMNVDQLDTEAFHIIFCLMITFTILVERLQKMVGKRAKASVVEARLMNRVNAELMMFGCVGLSIFVITNLYTDIPKNWTLYITFADILASLAACSMIVVSLLLYWMRNLTLPFLLSFETSLTEKKKKQREESPPTLFPQKSPRRGFSEVEELSRSRSGLFNGLGQHEYEMMITVFSKKHTIPPDSLYVDYLSDCLTSNACDIMDLKWSSWVVIVFFSLPSFAFRYLKQQYDGKYPSFFHYVVGYAITNYLFLSCAVIIFLSVNQHYNKMFHYLASIGKDGEAVQYENPMTTDLPKRIKWGMQVITLLNAFSFAAFLMSWVYNLSIRHAHWSVYVLLLTPNFVSTCLILPLTIFRFTITHAFYVPYQASLDALFEQHDRLEDDLNYLGRLYERKGRPQLPELEKGCDEEKLAKVVRGLGLHISDARMHRIFERLDFDRSGEVDAHEFFENIKCAGEASFTVSTPRGRTFAERDGS